MKTPQHPIEIALWLLGGLALFLYGIEIMGRSLQEAAGNQLRSGLGWVTKTRFHALFTGLGATVLLQSSSASTVMIVGFISAGLMTFRQSIGLILGANIGSTVTAQLTAFKSIDDFALPLLGVGFVFYFLARRRLLRRLGAAVMGFGMLFFGLLIMKQTVETYRAAIEVWFGLYTHGGLRAQVIAFLVATLATCILQSSAATIGIIQALATGPHPVIGSLDAAIPLILGCHVGTCITAVLASIGASLSAKRAAWAHVAINVIEVFTTIVFFKLFVYVVPRTTDSMPRQIANCHLAIKLVNVSVLLPMCYGFVRLMERVIRGKDTLETAPMFLDYNLLDRPTLALEAASREIARICRTCIQMLHDAVDGFIEDDEPKQELVLRREKIVDELVKATGHYLVLISRHALPPDTVGRPATLFYMMNDAERIGDHAENIAELGQTHAGVERAFSELAVREVRRLQQMAKEMGERTLRTLESPTIESAAAVLEQEKAFDAMHLEFRENHAARLARGECSVVSGIVYLDLITNLARAVNHVRNVALAATGQKREE